MTSETERLSVHLEEYKALKAETLQRVLSRDRSTYLAVVSIGAAVTLFDKWDHPALLFLVPWVCLLFGWQYLMNDVKISHAGDYFRDNLGPRIQECVDLKEHPFQWSFSHAEDRLRFPRKIFQTFVDISIFVLPAVVAIAIYFYYTRSHSQQFHDKPFADHDSIKLLDMVAYASAGAHVLFVVQLIVYSRYTGYKRKPTIQHADG